MRADIRLALITTTTLFVLSACGRTKEWERLQRSGLEKRRSHAKGRGANAAIARAPLAVREIRLPGLHREDRCITCHVNIQRRGLSDLKAPFGAHPDSFPSTATAAVSSQVMHGLLLRHPIKRFGCTVCHGGWSEGLTVEAAHSPPSGLAGSLLPKQALLAACSRCHDSEDLPGGERLMRGRQLLDDKRCGACHRFEGRGRFSGGPDLASLRHLRNPDRKSLVSHMSSAWQKSPLSRELALKFSPSELDDLVLFCFSLVDRKNDGYYASRKSPPGTRTGRQLYETLGCTGCHELRGRGGQVAQALDRVAGRRSEAWLQKFLASKKAERRGCLPAEDQLKPKTAAALASYLRARGEELRHFMRRMTPDTIARGRAVFRRRHCDACHGEDGAGGVRNANAQTGEEILALTKVRETLTSKEILAVLDKGVKMARLKAEGRKPQMSMPSFKGLSAQEKTDLCSYLMSLSTADPDDDWGSDSAVPPEDAGPPDDVGPPGDAAPPDDVGPPDDAGPPDDVGPPGDAAPPDDAGPPGGPLTTLAGSEHGAVLGADEPCAPALALAVPSHRQLAR